jgi:ferric-dicitrate binding protein FerR (iron transport regulator)
MQSEEHTPSVMNADKAIESDEKRFKASVERAVAGAVLQAADPTRRRVLAQLGAVALMARCFRLADWWLSPRIQAANRKSRI